MDAQRARTGARRDLRQEGRALLADARRLEAQAIESILNAAPILCATTTGLDSEIIGRRPFDLLVLDEACQTTEPGCWIPLLRQRASCWPAIIASCRRPWCRRRPLARASASACSTDW